MNNGDILVIDDEKSSLKLLSEILKKAGYTVRLAENGELALRSVKAKLPELILLDIKLPGIDGYEVCRRLKDSQETNDIPVIFMSSLTDPVDKARAFSLGCVDYCSKPFELDELMTRVLAHLSLYKAKKESEENNLKLQQEITERKKVEEALLESENRCHELFENANDLIQKVGPDGKILLVNKKWLETMEYSEEEVKGLRVTDILREDQIAHTMELLQGVAKGETVNGFETIFITKKGKEIYVEGNGNGIFKDGKFIAAIGIFRDITERKHTKEQIRFLSSVVEQSADGMAICDMEGNLLFVNNTWVSMHGYEKAEELLGQNLSVFHNEEQLKDVVEFNRKVKEKGHNTGELSHIRRDSTIFPTQMTTTLLRDENDNPIAIAGAATNITERKEREAELNQYREHLEELVNERTREVKLAKEDAEHANMAKTNFLQTMSHEFRTPLNAILGFSELLKGKKSGELNEKQELYIDYIITGGNNLFNIISQILDIVNMDEGTFKLHIEKIPVPEIVDTAIDVIKEKAVKMNVLIEKNLDPELEYIEADKQKFRQILLYLLDNAVKFSKPAGGTVTLTSKKEGDMAKFSVSDTGIGIRDDDVGKLFRKFTQLNTGTNRKYGGTGIGLVISKQLVELHGGTITAESTYDKGSTFAFSLPLTNSYGG